ncbi:MAG: histidine kinase, partial [Salibacteraceae bacterium]
QATQLQLLSAQMNPHFIFNALSSIQHSILHNQMETSLNFISSFATLMRQVLENSRKKLISWNEEQSFLKNYLDIEKFRFEGKFCYQFKVDDDLFLENVYVPPMLIQPYLENTVVHGLAQLTERKGEVSISLFEKNNRMCIQLLDNGVGREKALKKRKLRIGEAHVSRAMSISQQRIELLNTVYNSTAFEVIIDDLYDTNGNANGTKVSIFFPNEMEE